MKKYLFYVSAFVLLAAQFAANTPSQFGSFQLEAPKELKKWFTFLVLYNYYTKVLSLLYNRYW